MSLAAPASRPPALVSGSGGLEIARVAGQSAAVSAWAASPLKLLVPRSRGPSVWAYLSSFGGGLVAGDETSLNVRLGAGTRCFLGTQASTKVYRNPHSRPCSHRVEARLEADSLLVLAPDPVQAFAGAEYDQRQAIHLSAGSGLVLVDSFCSGRVARGERWVFSRLRSRTDVFLGPERVLVDSLLLDPADGPLGGSHRLGRFNCVAMVLILGAPVAGLAARVLAEIAARPVTQNAALVAGASPVREGALLRLAGTSAEAVSREIYHHLGALREPLGDDPWARKW